MMRFWSLVLQQVHSPSKLLTVYKDEHEDNIYRVFLKEARNNTLVLLSTHTYPASGSGSSQFCVLCMAGMRWNFQRLQGVEA